VGQQEDGDLPHYLNPENPMKYHRTPAVLSMIAVLTLAAIATLGFPADALAASAAGMKPTASLVYDMAAMASVSLAGLRMQVADIMTRANAKMAEAVEGLDVDALRRIEADHAAILKEADPIRAEITEEERKLAAPPVSDAGPSGPSVEDERKRAADILDLAERHGQVALGRKAVADGQTVDAFRASLLDKLVKAEPTVQGNARVLGPAGGEKRGEAIVNALLHRHDMRAYKLDDASRDFRGMSLIDIARDSLETAGRSTRGMSRQEIASEALAAGQRSGGMHSTSDFPFVLANVASKTLRAAYEQSPQTFRPLVREVSVPDFKSVSRVQMGEAPAFERVNEHGEFERGTIGEGREQYSIATYGKVVAITRQVIINDDLSAFTRVPQAFGFQAANLESDLVWAQIVGNPVMGDGQTLFHSTHGNVLTPAGISADSVAAGFEAMRLQKGLDGKTLLNIMPAYIIAPVAAQMKVSQFLTAITASQTASTVPDYIRTVTPIIEPRLDGGFTNPVTGAAVAGNRFNWFMAAAPGMVDTVELAYLEGQQGVYTETRTGFDVDGVEVKVRLDAGSKVIDWRAFARNLATGL
jgi:hypothetical protein